MATAGPNIVQKNVQFAKEDIEWFEQTYPNGSLSWLCGLLLEKFRAAHKFTPADYAALAAEELKDEIES